MVMLTELADVLRDGGLNVVEQPGWKQRGRGPMTQVRGVLLHHTAGSKKGNAPSLNLVSQGRTDLPGPLSQLLLARDGTFFVIGAGLCNHAGKGSWDGITSGNSSFIGIEAENAGDGTDPWPEVQMEAYVRGVATLLSHYGLSSNRAVGHREYATPRGRKIDPSFDMVDFRHRVLRMMSNGSSPASTLPPLTSTLRVGDGGDQVKLLQSRLLLSVDGHFGPLTEKSVKSFQERQGLIADGVVGPATWKKLAGA
mgnify:CR=1 FL=1